MSIAVRPDLIHICDVVDTGRPRVDNTSNTAKYTHDTQQYKAMRYIDEVVVPCVWMYRTDTRRRGILLVLQCIWKYCPKSISAYLPELTWYPRYLVPSERNFSHGGTQPMAFQRLCDLTEIAAVDRRQNMIIQDLPKPPSDYPDSYKWVVSCMHRVGVRNGYVSVRIGHVSKRSNRVC